jgi:hypothetical protein
VVQQDRLRPGLGIEEFHAMIEIVVLQPGSGAIHGAGGSRRDVDDGNLRCRQARAVGRLVGRILRHDLEGTAILTEEDRDSPRGDQHASASDGDQEIGPGLARGIPGGTDVRVGAVLFDPVEDPGEGRSQRFLDTPNGVGSPVDRRRADDEGALGAGAGGDLLEGTLEDFRSAVQTPTMARGTKAHSISSCFRDLC